MSKRVVVSGFILGIVFVVIWYNYQADVGPGSEGYVSPVIQTGMQKETIEPGSIALLPYAITVDIVESDRQCTVEYDGVLEVLEVHGEALVVRYSEQRRAYPGECQDTHRMHMKMSEFAGLTALWSLVKDLEKAERALVAALLDKSFFGQPQAAGDRTLVRAVNPAPLRVNTGYGDVRYGDTCVIGTIVTEYVTVKAGSIVPRGEAGQRTLYEYTPEGEPIGDRCPPGVLFFK